MEVFSRDKRSLSPRADDNSVCSRSFWSTQSREAIHPNVDTTNERKRAGLPSSARLLTGVGPGRTHVGFPRALSGAAARR